MFIVRNLLCPVTAQRQCWELITVSVNDYSYTSPISKLQICECRPSIMEAPTLSR